MNLLELAAKVEAATGPDRELDALIACAVHWRWDGWHPDDPKVEDVLERHGVQYLFDRVKNSHNSIWKHLPKYTAIIDAAMTLYVTVPQRVPSNPRQATAEALRQRAEAA